MRFTKQILFILTTLFASFVIANLLVKVMPNQLVAVINGILSVVLLIVVLIAKPLYGKTRTGIGFAATIVAAIFPSTGILWWYAGLHAFVNCMASWGIAICRSESEEHK